jgi:hypothetical protein
MFSDAQFFLIFVDRTPQADEHFDLSHIRQQGTRPGGEPFRVFPAFLGVVLTARPDMLEHQPCAVPLWRTGGGFLELASRAQNGWPTTIRRDPCIR